MKLDWRQIAIAVSAGLLIGVLGGQWAALRRFRRGPPQPPQVAERLARRFALDDAQKAKVEAIVTDRRAKMEALRAEIEPKFDKLREDSRAEIRKVLTPEQQKRFDEHEAARRQRRAGHRPLFLRH